MGSSSFTADYGKALIAYPQISALFHHYFRIRTAAFDAWPALHFMHDRRCGNGGNGGSDHEVRKPMQSENHAAARQTVF